uniref:Uncharacterized protein n=1 Tax=Oryza punctata TaxID=4537 RepID=A0A0E0MIU1_ORYPU
MIFIVSLLTASEEPRVKKLLVQHIETVHHSEAVQDVLHSLLHSDLDAKEIKSKTKEWNNRTKQDKKQDQLRILEEMPALHRFGGVGKEIGMKLMNHCEKYAIFMMPSKITSFEEVAILCNFLPLIREHLPSAVEEIESDIISLAPSEAEDNPLYDYPEELSEDGDDGSDSKNPFSDPYGSDPEYEKEEVEEDNDEDGSREIDGLGANMG